MTNLPQNYWVISWTIVGFIATLLGGDKIEELLPPKHRKKVGKKLIQLKTKGFNETVSSAFNTRWFIKLFGKKHWSLKSISMSFFFTVLFTFLGFLLIWLVSDKFEFEQIINLVLSKNNIPFFISALLANCIIDYVSLFETRWVIDKVKSDTRIVNTLILLFMDLLFTLIIFIIGFTLFKTGLDLYELYPVLHENKEIVIRLGSSTIEATLTSYLPWYSNFLTLLVPTLEYSFMSIWTVLTSNFEQYWFSTLYLPGGKHIYTIHAGTLWLTTHLSSIYIYFAIIFWLITKLLIYINRPVLFLLPRNIDPMVYPYKIIVLNVALLGLLVLTVIFIIDFIRTMLS